LIHVSSTNKIKGLFECMLGYCVRLAQFCAVAVPESATSQASQILIRAEVTTRFASIRM